MARKNNICTSLVSDAQSAHLSCLDEEQFRIRQSNLERKRQAAEIRDSRIEDRPLAPLLYPSLGGGMFFNRGINPLSGLAVRELHEEIRTQRGYYYAWVKQENGKRKRKKRKTKPLKQLTLNFRRDYAMAFMACEGTPFQNLLLKELEDVILPEIIEYFEAQTNLEVISIHIHSEEGNLHLHLAFSKVSVENELLWLKREVGRHDLRLLNFSHTGTLRLVRGGFLDESVGEKARIDLADRMQGSGEEPIDWVLSKYLDDYCEDIFNREGLQPIYQQARDEYAEGLELRMAQKPKALKQELERMQSRVSEVEEQALQHASELERELETLRAQNAALKAENTRLKEQKPVVVAMPVAQPKSAKPFHQRIQCALPIELRGFEYENDCALTVAANALGDARGSNCLRTLSADPSIELTPSERRMIAWYGSLRSAPQLRVETTLDHSAKSFQELVAPFLPEDLQAQTLDGVVDLVFAAHSLGEDIGLNLLQKLADNPRVHLSPAERREIRSNLERLRSLPDEISKETTRSHDSPQLE